MMQPETMRLPSEFNVTDVELTIMFPIQNNAQR